MSFILDALKKSEAQRQRADAPALYEMKMAPPRQSVPAWLLVLGGLLIINIAVLTVVLLRSNHSAAPQTGAATTTVAPPPAALTPAPVTAPAAPAPAVTSAAGAGTPPASGTLGAASNSSADDAPAVEPAPAPAPAPTADSRSDVQTYDQAASAPGANLPELKLDLHAYASNPADRFVYLNMVKLKEGDSSPAGVRVESITPDGAILSWHGSKFFLQRQ